MWVEGRTGEGDELGRGWGALGFGARGQLSHHPAR